MELECSLENLNDSELDQILHEIKNDDSGLGLIAIDVLDKIAYCDLSHGIDSDLCSLIISSTNSFSHIDKNAAANVLRILQNHKIIYEKAKKNPNRLTTFQMLPNLQEKLLIENRKSSSVINELANTFQKIWMDENIFVVFSTVNHVFNVHKSLKDFNWPDGSIKCSVYFAVALLIDASTSNMEIGLQILKDASVFLETKSSSKSMNSSRNDANFLAIQMIRIHNDTITKSRKLLQPSDTITVVNINEMNHDIRLDEYGSWILNRIRFFMESKIDCDAIILVGVATLERLQKHARFCNKPEDLTINWILSYNGKEWHNFNCFAALACFGSTDEWLQKMCHAYIKKLNDKMQYYGKSEYSSNNVYLSWVCLRDLVKTSRIREQMISALTDEDGLQLLFMNFKKCASLFVSKEYCLKYQGQTVMEMLTPLLIHGKPEDVGKLLNTQEFWNFVKLILIKHPFINERYDVTLENDLLCACEVYLDLLVAICKRNNDCISEGFLKSFLSQDYLETFITVLKVAEEIVERRQRHSCIFYLFTVLFTLFDILNDTELADIYFNNEDIFKEIEEFSQENFCFEVQDGCLREYRKHLKSFMQFFKNKSKTTAGNFTSIARLVHNMTSVTEKYDWESDGDEKLK